MLWIMGESMKAAPGLRGLFSIFFGFSLCFAAAMLIIAGFLLYGILSSGHDLGTLAFSFSFGSLLLFGTPAWFIACFAGLLAETRRQAQAVRGLWILLAAATLALIAAALMG